MDLISFNGTLSVTWWFLPEFFSRRCFEKTEVFWRNKKKHRFFGRKRTDRCGSPQQKSLNGFLILSRTDGKQKGFEKRGVSEKLLGFREVLFSFMSLAVRLMEEIRLTCWPPTPVNLGGYLPHQPTKCRVGFHQHFAHLGERPFYPKSAFELFWGFIHGNVMQPSEVLNHIGVFCIRFCRKRRSQKEKWQDIITMRLVTMRTQT